MSSEVKIQKRSDRIILSSLLTSGKLTPTEEKAFRSMLESLDSGQLKLTASQRLWAEQIFEKLRLDTKSPPTQVIKSRTAKANEQRIGEHPYDAMIRNRPLKPPGRN